VLSFAVYLFIPEAYSKSASGWPHFVDRLILRQVNKKKTSLAERFRKDRAMLLMHSVSQRKLTQNKRLKCQK
jgi:hypothetical protein